VREVGTGEAIWAWVRAEVTANTCFGTKAQVREKVGAFFHGLTTRTHEVKHRCRTVLQTHAEAFATQAAAILRSSRHVDSALAQV
jgi:hypothetical protein